MYRRHLRYQYGMPLSHFLGKQNLLAACIALLQLITVSVPFVHCSLQRPYANPCRTKVVDLIYLQNRIYLPVLDSISSTWSVVTASRPQPKEFNCTSSRLVWSFTKLAAL